MLWIFLIATLAIWLITKLFKDQMYWSKNNVKQNFPIPIFGDNLATFFLLESFTTFFKRLYFKFSDVRYFGIYRMTTPTLVVRDPDLIKQISIKDFDYFTDHRYFLPDENDPLWSKNLFALRGDQWRDMRATLSPAFTSSKMRSMFYLMNECAEQYANYYAQFSDKTELEMKDSFTRYGTDVIAICALGLKCDSLKERENEFYMMGKEATDFTKLSRNLKLFLYLLAPTLYKILGLRFFSNEIYTKFIAIVKNAMKVREEQHIIRHDMLHLLMEAKKCQLTHEEDVKRPDGGFAIMQESHIVKSKKYHVDQLTDVGIAAQALLFFFAGFDATADLMSFMAYELAVNPDIQEKLRCEVDRVFQECQGKLTYEKLASMKYMDMVISETSRKWPVTIGVDRMCVKPYTIEPTRRGETAVRLKAGDLIWIPTIGLHHDPKYYPEPEKFDPERFNDDNKHSIHPGTYLPFGIGPRNCIASRFALAETKTVFFHILAKFEVVPVEKTTVPVTLSKKIFNLAFENGNWLSFNKRTH